MGSVGKGDLTMLETLHQAGLLTVILRSQKANNSQWCLDWYGNYPGGRVIDPIGATAGSYRVQRGGGWWNVYFSCRSASRSAIYPNDFEWYVGFRVALAPVP